MRENLPTSLDNTPELAGHIHKLQQMHEVAAVNIKDFYQPTDIFIQPNEVDSTDLDTNNTTSTENHRGNGVTLLHSIQPSSLYLLLIDISVT